jgi:pyrimidine-nucleoside phosphorylase
MLIQELIKKKRDKIDLSTEEITSLIDGYVAGSVPDYQMSAFAMAVFFNGMTEVEKTALVQSMINSGERVEFEKSVRFVVDKHSTGGIGDKTSLILAPIVAACGGRVPMIAGRGLGHTGGTLDKLESIPGTKIFLSLDEFKKKTNELGLCYLGQTGQICPADKKLYALRDVTATVESLPLICASIMSKKIAEGISFLTLDVKYGAGAFMKTTQQAEELALALMEVGESNGVRVNTAITSMEQPLGRFIGNALEIKECVEIMKGASNQPEFYNETAELSIELAAMMISLGKGCDLTQARAQATDALKSGRAYEVFEKVISAQGGDLSGIKIAKNTKDVLAPSDGHVAAINGEQLGYAAINLGAGRLKTTDPIDHSSGIECLVKIGSKVSKGEPIFRIYCDEANKIHLAESRILDAVRFSESKPPEHILIHKHLGI